MELAANRSLPKTQFNAPPEKQPFIGSVALLLVGAALTLRLRPDQPFD